MVVQVVSRDIRRILTQRAQYFNIYLDDVSITNLTFSREYTGAVEAKQVAQQEAERARFIVSILPASVAALTSLAMPWCSLIRQGMRSGIMIRISGSIVCNVLELCAEYTTMTASCMVLHNGDNAGSCLSLSRGAHILCRLTKQSRISRVPSSKHKERLLQLASLEKLFSRTQPSLRSGKLRLPVTLLVPYQAQQTKSSSALTACY